MPNIQRKISSHNAKVLQTETGHDEEVFLPSDQINEDKPEATWDESRHSICLNVHGVT